MQGGLLGGLPGRLPLCADVGPDRLGDAFAVEGGRDDAAGIACSLAGGEEPLHFGVHEADGVARDADGGRGARFDADDHRFVGDEAPHPASEGLQAGPQPLGDEGGQPAVEARGGDARDVGGGGERRRGAAGDEIGDALGGSHLPVAPLAAGQLLELLLEVQAGERAPLRLEAGEIREAHLRDEPRIGIGRGAAAGRHTVHDRLGRLGHRRNDEAARAHAEGVDAAAGLLADERVGGGGEVFAALGAVVLDAVDESLRVLDADPHGERFGLESDALGVEQPVNIAGRVARCQDDGGPLDALVAAADPREAVAAAEEAGQAPPEEHLAAAVGDRAADVAEDVGEFVGADVGVRLVEDRGVGAVVYERLQRLVVVSALLAAGEELAVGEGAGAALAEGVVRIGIDRLAAVDAGDVALAGRDVAPPFEEDRAEPQLDEAQRSEEPRGARTDDDDLGAPGDRRIVEAGQGGLRLAVDVDLEREADDGLAPAGVDRPLEDPHEGDVALGDAQLSGRQRRIALDVGRVARRKLQGQGAGHRFWIFVFGFRSRVSGGRPRNSGSGIVSGSRLRVRPRLPAPVSVLGLPDRFPTGLRGQK